MFVASIEVALRDTVRIGIHIPQEQHSWFAVERCISSSASLGRGEARYPVEADHLVSLRLKIERRVATCLRILGAIHSRIIGKERVLF